MSEHFILHNISDFTENINNNNNNNNNEEKELVILKIPLKLMDKKVQTKIDNLFKKRKRNYEINNNNNNNKKIKTTYRDGNIKSYFETLTESTKKCIEIFINNYGIENNHIFKEKNIFCPFHENKHKSNSPSAKFIVKKNFYICFSTNCPLRKNSYTKINSIDLLKELLLLAQKL